VWDDMVRQVVRIAGDVFCTAVVLIDFILGLQEAFGLLYGGVEFYPGSVVGESDSLGVETGLDEPVADGGDGVVGGLEGVCDARGGPVIAVVRGSGVGDVEKEVFDVVYGGLSEAKTEGKDGVLVVPGEERPTLGRSGTSLEEGVREKEWRCVERGEKSDSKERVE
jgi:hypothetical protein